MSTARVERSPLVLEVLSGRKRELQLLAAQGILPLPPEDLIELQVNLAASSDPEVARTAEAALRQIEHFTLLGHLKRDARADVCAYFARVRIEDPMVVETVLQRRDLAVELACELAPRLSPDMQEILLLRQDLIVEHQEVLRALEQNPTLSTYSKRRIIEYRQHLIGPEQPRIEPSPVREVSYETTEISDIELVSAVQAVLEQIEPEGEVDLKTGLSEGQVRALPVPMRIKLARGAARTLRGILIRDQNPLVATSVLTTSAVTESEIEQVSNSRLVVEEVLVHIAHSREWSGKYNIVVNLVRNPRTPIAIAIRNLARLSVRDLASLNKDRNVSDAVRQNAGRLHKVKAR